MILKKKCITCKISFSKKVNVSIKSWSKVMFCSRKCRGEYQSKYLIGKKSSNYKGGTVTKRGYISIYISGKRMYEHRHVMEQFLKRKLNVREHVHHINHNKEDNRIENLELIDIQDHSRLHYPKGSRFGKNKIVE